MTTTNNIKSQIKPLVVVLASAVALITVLVLIQNHARAPATKAKNCFSIEKLTEYFHDSTELMPLQYVEDRFFLLMTRDSSAVLTFVGDSSCITKVDGFFKYGDLLRPRERARNLAIRARLFMNAVGDGSAYEQTMEVAATYAFEHRGDAYQKNFRNVAFTLKFDDTDSMAVMSFFHEKDRRLPEWAQ